MDTMIKYLKLPYRFAVADMQREVSALTTRWQDHYNQRDYEGSWTALPLRSADGSAENTVAYTGRDTVFTDTPLMEQCPCIRAAIDTLLCEKKAVRLLNLQAGAIIKEHRDKELSFESGEARIHIPIATSKAVEFYLEDERVIMAEGECWYMNFNLMHRVANGGTTDRIHLVIDCVVNDWLKAIFTIGDWEIKSIVKAPAKHSPTEKQAIINALLHLNTPASLSMAEEMSRES